MLISFLNLHTCRYEMKCSATQTIVGRFLVPLFGEFSALRSVPWCLVLLLADLVIIQIGPAGAAAGCSDAVSSAQFPSTFCREFPSNCRKNAKLAAPENKPVSVMTGYTINIKNPNRLIPLSPSSLPPDTGRCLKTPVVLQAIELYCTLHIYISSHENQYCNIS